MRERLSVDGVLRRDDALARKGESGSGASASGEPFSETIDSLARGARGRRGVAGREGLNTWSCGRDCAMSRAMRRQTGRSSHLAVSMMRPLQPPCPSSPSSCLLEPLLPSVLQASAPIYLQITPTYHSLLSALGLPLPLQRLSPVSYS